MNKKIGLLVATILLTSCDFPENVLVYNDSCADLAGLSPSEPGKYSLNTFGDAIVSVDVGGKVESIDKRGINATQARDWYLNSTEVRNFIQPFGTQNLDKHEWCWGGYGKELDKEKAMSLLEKNGMLEAVPNEGGADHHNLPVGLGGIGGGNVGLIVGGKLVANSNWKVDGEMVRKGKLLRKVHLKFKVDSKYKVSAQVSTDQKAWHSETVASVHLYPNSRRALVIFQSQLTDTKTVMDRVWVEETKNPKIKTCTLQFREPLVQKFHTLMYRE